MWNGNSLPRTRTNRKYNKCGLAIFACQSFGRQNTKSHRAQVHKLVYLVLFGFEFLTVVWLAVVDMTWFRGI